MTSSGKNGLNIRTNASPKWDRDQVSGGVSVLCWLASFWSTALRYHTSKEGIPRFGPLKNMADIQEVLMFGRMPFHI